MFTGMDNSKRPRRSPSVKRTENTPVPQIDYVAMQSPGINSNLPQDHHHPPAPVGTQCHDNCSAIEAVLEKYKKQLQEMETANQKLLFRIEVLNRYLRQIDRMNEKVSSLEEEVRHRTAEAQEPVGNPASRDELLKELQQFQWKQVYVKSARCELEGILAQVEPEYIILIADASVFIVPISSIAYLQHNS